MFKPLKLSGLIATFALTFIVAGCGETFKRQPPPPKPEHITVEAEKTSALSDREYLMRKATLGSRSERMEALDVIERTVDAEWVTFLLERLEKEDDPFIRVKVMNCLGKAQDIRAVQPLRKIARWQTDRVGIEATVTLYQLGDDNYIPRLIRIMRSPEEFYQLSDIAYLTLKRIYKVDLPKNGRVWNTYYRSHRLAPYQELKWYASFRPPMPPTVAGSTKVIPRPLDGPRLPQEDVKVRRHVVSFFEFWKADEP